jgi:hypothetical protein
MSLFRIQEHAVPCQHIRQYPHATLETQEDVLYLAVKQYTPLDNLHPSSGDLTIIGGHANAFPKVFAVTEFLISIINWVKELYEPLWDELHQRSKALGFRIRNIWIADVAHQGYSSVLNESKLGNDRKYSASKQLKFRKTHMIQLHGSTTPEICYS